MYVYVHNLIACLPLHTNRGFLDLNNHPNFLDENRVTQSYSIFFGLYLSEIFNQNGNWSSGGIFSCC